VTTTLAVLAIVTLLSLGSLAPGQGATKNTDQAPSTATRKIPEASGEAPGKITYGDNDAAL
jgi:hypothetical protein